ncbi:RNA-guided endonuclease TnpB family protein [Streptomyces sp. NPDC056738]|uniref:RNA-guided endonuclease InsQ/TnpB family protein n=1 Tax=Streptomyces sp. NPDC056738 TaxID=3345933 RepID=UPI003691AC26
MTVIKDPSGRYFGSFVVQVEPEPLAPVTAEAGIDLGLTLPQTSSGGTPIAVLSDGKVIDNPRFLRRAERRLRKAQQALSRKAKGSRNRAKARLKVARAHARVADARRNWCHQNASRLVRDNQAVYLEDLAVSGLARTRLAKSVHDAAWGMFRRVLEDKAARAGRHVGVVSRWLPSSQTCSVCWVVDGKKPLHVRTWRCSGCGTEHDRDLNASRVILAAGQAERLNAPGGPVSPGVETPRQAPPVERGTHPKAQPVTTGSQARIPAFRAGRMSMATLPVEVGVAPGLAGRGGRPGTSGGWSRSRPPAAAIMVSGPGSSPPRRGTGMKAPRTLPGDARRSRLERGGRFPPARSVFTWD